MSQPRSSLVFKFASEDWEFELIHRLNYRTFVEEIPQHKASPTHRLVDKFHAEAMAQGGTDLGAPGPRPHYGPTYYAAFIADPDGYKLEAVHQQK